MPTGRSMKLTDLNPRWCGAGGPGIFNRDPQTGNLTPAPKRDGVGLILSCPCGSTDCQDAYIPFSNPLDGGPAVEVHAPTWEREGDDFTNLTLRPSIQRMQGCRWHGWITNGEIIKA